MQNVKTWYITRARAFKDMEATLGEKYVNSGRSLFSRILFVPAG